jgi:glycosyltransferase domain-containing protein
VLGYGVLHKEQAFVQSEYTLVVPTYNRSKQLERLLSYLTRENAAFPILILDSSHEEHRLNNQAIIKQSSLKIYYCEYDTSIKPFDKFYDGVTQVKTLFCQLCADDDFILVKEIPQCIQSLKAHPDASVVHGYYFSFFECDVQKSMDISQILYYTPTNDAVEPLLRLRNLFKQYQALTYGVYRTPILKRILHTIKDVNRILARELLASALAVIYGKIIRLPCFTHGRSMAASESYQFWHPLEWLVRTPEGLFSEYKDYKKILVAEIMSLPNNGSLKEEVERKVDLIHVDYLLHHAPLNAYEFLMDNIFSGKAVDEIWPDHAVQIPLIEAANTQHKACPALTFTMRVFRKLRGLLGIKSVQALEGRYPEETKTSVRTYRLHQNFLEPMVGYSISVKPNDISELTMALDNYY